MDMNELRGMQSAKRAVEIASAGGLSLLIVGGAGQGKSALIAAGNELLDVRLSRRPRFIGLREDDCNMDETADTTDMYVRLSNLSAANWFMPAPAESTADVAERVARVRGVSHLILELDGSARALISDAWVKMGLSPRRAESITRVASTLAWMDDLKAQRILRIHVAEALSYTYVSEDAKVAIAARRGALRAEHDRG